MAADLLRRAPNLAPHRTAGLVHGFTSRSGGVSGGALGSLNLALRGEEQPENVVENWSRVMDALDAGLELGSLALLEQVHGADVVRVERGAGPLAVVARADAAYCTEPGVVLAVRVADCVPVLLGGAGVVAVAHAGWRGTAANIVGALVGELLRIGVNPGDLSAAIGPCISGPAYPVGPEVVDGLRAAGIAPSDFLVPPTERSPRAAVDLRRAVAAQLAAAGVPDVWLDPRCTATDTGLYSHRRDGAGTGRLAGVIARLR